TNEVIRMGRSRSRDAEAIASSMSLPDSLFVWSYRLYPSLLDAIIIVQPETVIRWHRRGFRAYWRWKSRHVGGRPRMDSGIRSLIPADEPRESAVGRT